MTNNIAFIIDGVNDIRSPCASFSHRLALAFHKLNTKHEPYRRVLKYELAQNGCKLVAK